MKKLITISLLSSAILIAILFIREGEGKIDNHSAYQKYLTELIKDNSRDEFEGKEEKEGSEEKFADEPDMAFFQDYIMTLDPSQKRVPTERLADAYTKMKSIKGSKLSVDNQITWENVSCNMGGRTRAFMFDPNDETNKKAWAGSVTGGLWYNLNVADPNSSWVAVNDFWDNLTVSCIAYDPNNKKVFYVGTGEGQTALKIYRESSGVGIGIWKSEDGGDTWSIMPSTSKFKYITDIVVRNENGVSVIYAGVISGKYHDVDHLSEPSDGLYRSTDNGQTWVQVLPNITGESSPYAVSDIELAKDDRIIVGTMQNINKIGGGVVLYSDLGTSGSWTEYKDLSNQILQQGSFNLPGRIVLSAAPSDKNIIYAAVASGYVTPEDDFSVFHGKYIIKSEDNGATWVLKNLPTPQTGTINWAYIAWHAMAIKVSPNDPNILLVGGLDLNRSVDGGNTWMRISDWKGMYYSTPLFVHADIHNIVFKPGSNTEIYITTDGGVFGTADFTVDSPSYLILNRNFSTLQFYTCDIKNDISKTYFLGGLQDNGCVLYNGNPIANTDMLSGGDGAYCFFDDNEEMVLTASQYNNWYFYYNNLQAESYFNGSSASGVFINTADYDSYNNTLYTNAVTYAGANAGKLCRITGIPLNPTGQILDLSVGNSAFFSAIKISPFSTGYSKTLFVGTAAGQLFKVQNAQGTPSTVEISGNNFPNGYISSIAIGENENTILVTFSNYGVSSVWQTTDGGHRWYEKEGNLPDMPIRYAIYNPYNYNEVLVATELGVWRTTNINADVVEWAPELNGLANVRVDMMKIRETDNRIILASHGRGLYTGIWDSFEAGIDDSQFGKIEIFPNPATEYIHVKANNLPAGNYTIQLVNSSGVVVYSKQVNDPSKELTINTPDFNTGLYLLNIKGSNINKTKRVLIRR